MGDVYAKGRTLFDTKDLFAALLAFEEALGSDATETLHAVVSYPCNADSYKQPCSLAERKESFAVSSQGQASYDTFGAAVGKVKNIRDEQFLVGVFDFSIAAANIDSLYDYKTGEFLDVSDIQVRRQAREWIIDSLSAAGNRFVMEDSPRGFHLFFRCGLNEFFAPTYRYALLQDKYVCRYNILSCRPETEFDFWGNPQIVPNGLYTLLGYGRRIEGYRIEFIGDSQGLSAMPSLFFGRPACLSYKAEIACLQEQERLRRWDVREKVRREIFYEWFLSKPHSLARESAIERMVSRYIKAIGEQTADTAPEGIFTEGADGMIGVIRLEASASPVRAEAVRRATIKSVYEFYAYLSTLEAGAAFNDEQILQEFLRFCRDRSLEARGLWNYSDGKFLFANRFYKVLLNLSRKNNESRLIITKNSFRVL